MPLFTAHLYPELKMLPGTTPYLDRSLWILLHSDLQNTKRVRLLVDFLADTIRSQRRIFLGPLA